MEKLNHERLDEMEERAVMAERVSLPVEDFLALVAAARNGLRPQLVREGERHE